MLRIKVEEQIVGNVTDLPGAEGTEWSTNEEGQTTRTVEDKSGTLIELQIPPPTENEESVEESSSESQSGDPQQEQQGGGAQEAAGQVTNQVGQAVQGVQDTVGGVTDQAQGLVGGSSAVEVSNRARKANSSRVASSRANKAERCRDADLSRLTQLRPPTGAAVRKE